MHIIMLRNTFVEGRAVSIGQTVETSDAIGLALVQIGKATRPAPVQADESVAVEIPAAVLRKSDGAIEDTSNPLVEVERTVAPAKKKSAKGAKK